MRKKLRIAARRNVLCLSGAQSAIVEQLGDEALILGDPLDFDRDGIH
jgi:hypothetical protein